MLLLPATKIELCYKDVHLANMCYLQQTFLQFLAPYWINNHTHTQ